jgi:hypothetical protein
MSVNKKRNNIQIPPSVKVDIKKCNGVNKLFQTGTVDNIYTFDIEYTASIPRIEANI